MSGAARGRGGHSQGVMASWVGWGPMEGCGSRVLDEAGGCDLRGQQGPRKGEQAWEALLGFLEGVSRDPSAG